MRRGLIGFLTLIAMTLSLSPVFAAKKEVRLVGGEGGKPGSYGDKKANFTITTCVAQSGEPVVLTVRKVKKWVVQDRLINAHKKSKTASTDLKTVILKANGRTTWLYKPIVTKVTYGSEGMVASITSMKMITQYKKEASITVNCAK